MVFSGQDDIICNFFQHFVIFDQKIEIHRETGLIVSFAAVRCNCLFILLYQCLPANALP